MCDLLANCRTVLLLLSVLVGAACLRWVEESSGLGILSERCVLVEVACSKSPSGLILSAAFQFTPRYRVTSNNCSDVQLRGVTANKLQV